MNPETFVPSEGAYERYREGEVRLQNSIARANPGESVLAAMLRNEESYNSVKIGGKGLDEIIGAM